MTLSPPARRFNWKDLGLRALSAVVLIPLVIWAIAYGDWPFMLLIAIGASVMGLEWGDMSERRSPLRIGVAVSLGICVPIFAAELGDFSAAFVLLTFAATAAALFAKQIKASAIDAAYGVLYIGWPCVVLVWLRQQPDGKDWTVMLFAIAWCADIAAYAIGNVLKGPKLWPRFSPNKTWSGFLGGLLAGVTGGVIVEAFSAEVQLALWTSIVVGLVVGLATMAGDLWESALKRRFGVKDAGSLIPGHGGILDRVDGLMFAVIAIAASRLLLKAWGFA
ncbi:MAG: phosphatidate cytidylyltransferase [Caulobacteraceae bacterium]|nr:phosphatidate cytidylyltransferase [Caulobacteraceae bacterium]